ncbi:hypothetical protein [Helicobacter pylori]|uniref:Uncharacterized protein n=1 Tax=Helicobacter pylori Hp P-4 TaxID=992075 RepID=J0PTQ8_HELPX|nr:hypothetical protein [Helicobacter pylori]EJC02078.1 hypothetical protein HPHPP4_1172 [Helicobacter pylori Hp P-4]EJC22289.1 hypothetical protein HPHPP4D_1382 [Helicobacter pylori Hp P-4d]EJC23003.1 hypothetical protein HPHPP4C_1195 [Helicobacter pylori Hp P-4c]
MWNEKFLKVIPAVVFLFCLLEIFELVLIINDMNKTEKLEAEVKNNLNVLEDITILLNEHAGCMQLEHFEDKNIKIK